MDSNTLASALRRHALESYQIENALLLRRTLQEIRASVRTVKTGTNAVFNGFYPGGLPEWEKTDPQGYEQYQQFKNLCTQVLHSLVGPEFRLYPSWINKKPLQELNELWSDLVPFTAMALHAHEGTDSIESSIINVIKAIDELFPSE